jgi:uncharacterized metal-binding protein YceD (DUF177 family)
MAYRIPFTGLKNGKHTFEYDINERFFSEYDYSLVKNGEIKVALELDKQETMLILLFRITGHIYLDCDVCLAKYPMSVDLSERVIAKFGEQGDDDEDEDIIYLGRNDHEIDISGLIYEYVNLSAPYISRCGDEGNTRWCDKEMIERLRSLSANEEKSTAEPDPRWEALKKIKKN